METKIINLISDTVTKPCPDMLHAMMNAEVGDDVFGTDPSINQLESYGAELFGKEAALFCPSGTMTNQIALNLLTQPMDEVICEVNSHIFHYENAAYAMHSGIGLNTINGVNGKLNISQIEETIRPQTDWYPRSTTVVLENTCNKAGGTHYSMEEMRSISDFCKNSGLSLHLDGARIFNAAVIEGFDLKDLGVLFDTISTCLSKGLGAPVGSLLVADQHLIAKARRIRKALGGGMRQAGYLAKAGLYALNNNIERLKEDHQKADLIKDTLKDQSFVMDVKPGRTNIVIFDLKEGISAQSFIEKLKENGIHCSAFGPQTIRMVTHKDVSMEEIDYCCEMISTLFK